MTPAVARMREIAALVAGSDPVDYERVHVEADQLVVEALREHGENDLADAYDEARVFWWYA